MTERQKQIEEMDKAISELNDDSDFKNSILSIIQDLEEGGTMEGDDPR